MYRHIGAKAVSGRSLFADGCQPQSSQAVVVIGAQQPFTLEPLVDRLFVGISVVGTGEKAGWQLTPQNSQRQQKAAERVQIR